MTDPIDLDALRLGGTLPPMVHVPTREQCVRYAGAANDFSPIHYDDEIARRRGFPGVIVHGLLKAAFLAELLERWATPNGGWVRKLSTQYRGIDYPGRPLVCHARVAAKSVAADSWLVDFDVWIADAQGETTTWGTATVDFGKQAPTS